MYRPSSSSRSSSVTRDYGSRDHGIYAPTTSITPSKNPIPYSRSNIFSSSPFSSNSSDILSRYSRASSVDPVGIARNGYGTSSAISRSSYGYNRDEEDRSLGASKLYGSASQISSSNSNLGSTYSRYKVSQPASISHGSTGSARDSSYFRIRAETSPRNEMTFEPNTTKPIERRGKKRQIFELLRKIFEIGFKKVLDDVEVRFQRLYDKYVKNEDEISPRAKIEVSKTDENERKTPIQSIIKETFPNSTEIKERSPKSVKFDENPKNSPKPSEISLDASIKNQQEPTAKTQIPNQVTQMVNLELKSENLLRPMKRRTKSKLRSRSNSKEPNENEKEISDISRSPSPKISENGLDNGLLKPMKIRSRSGSKERKSPVEHGIPNGAESVQKISEESEKILEKSRSKSRDPENGETRKKSRSRSRDPENLPGKILEENGNSRISRSQTPNGIEMKRRSKSKSKEPNENQENEQILKIRRCRSKSREKSENGGILENGENENFLKARKSRSRSQSREKTITLDENGINGVEKEKESISKMNGSETKTMEACLITSGPKEGNTADAKSEISKESMQNGKDHLMSDSNDAGSSSENSFKKDATSLREKSKSPVKRRRRDPARNLDKLRESLAPLIKEKREGQNQLAENPRQIQTAAPPLVTVTRPSEPNTPTAEATFFDVQGTNEVCIEETFRDAIEADESSGLEEEEEEEDTEQEWTEATDEEDYESDFEYSVDTTFILKCANGKVKTTAANNEHDKSYSACVSRCSPMVSDYDSDNSVPFPLPSQPEDGRGRVNRLFANPAPTFSCSVSYDGQGWNSSSEEGTILSCQEESEDFDDYYGYKVLPIPKEGYSSSLGVYESAEEKESDEEYDGQEVGCTLRLVDRLAMKDSDSDYEDEEFYEDEEYDEELTEYEDEECELYESDIGLDSEGRDDEDDDRSEELKSIVEDRLTVDVIPPEMISSLIEMIECAEVEELVAVDENEEKAEERVVEGIEGQKEILFVPTYVKPINEDLNEESVNRFNSNNPRSDFARKSIVQPPKLEKATINVVEIRIGEPPKKEPEITKEPEPAQVDKSSVRKSILNMKADEAQKKREQNEKEAREKARGLGTVNAIANMLAPKNEEPIVYKKSSRLVQNYEVPKKKYEIVKPQIDDEFDKQLEELRAQMKAGSSALQNQLKELSKDVTKTAEDAKQKEKAAKHQQTVMYASGAFE
ncbi:hypothetical protein WR25_06146 isoform C [Diploscapter pachys]|nr:hypothetical protein WR25_06146 isoform C [Diploscapter pachys]